jgi:ATP-dependent helicase/nuclease subunit A
MERTRTAPLPDFLERLVELQQLGARAIDSPATLSHDDAMQMMTIHAAKGNEFSCVILGDLFRKAAAKAPAWLFDPELGFALRREDEFTPKGATTPEWEEMRKLYLRDEELERERLLYVALTRAKQQIVLPIHNDLATETPNKGNWHEHLGTFIHDRQ